MTRLLTGAGRATLATTGFGVGAEVAGPCCENSVSSHTPSPAGRTIPLARSRAKVLYTLVFLSPNAAHSETWKEPCFSRSRTMSGTDPYPALSFLVRATGWRTLTFGGVGGAEFGPVSPPVKRLRRDTFSN